MYSAYVILHIKTNSTTSTISVFHSRLPGPFSSSTCSRRQSLVTTGRGLFMGHHQMSVNQQCQSKRKSKLKQLKSALSRLCFQVLSHWITLSGCRQI